MSTPTPQTQPKLTIPNPSYKTIGELDMPLSLLLKGASGTGKTWLSAHFPSPLIISFDNNISGLKMLLKQNPEVGKKVRIFSPTVKDDGSQVPPIEVWDNCMNKLGDFLYDPSIKTVVFDSLTTMAAALENKILKTDSAAVNMQTQNWGEFGRFIKAFFETCCTSAHIKKHVVILAHENAVYEKSGEGPNAKEIFKGYELLLSSKVKNQLEVYCSDVWRLTIVNTQLGPSYEIQPSSQQHFSAKSTLECLTGQKSVPFNKVKDALVKELEGRIK